jgi:hypothetical protein
MKNIISSSVAVATILLMACSNVKEQTYEQNLACTTIRNVHYLKNLGYHIQNFSTSTGLIQASGPSNTKLPSNLVISYPGNNINPYVSQTTRYGSFVQSSVTAYWLPGKELMKKRSINQVRTIPDGLLILQKEKPKEYFHAATMPHL